MQMSAWILNCQFARNHQKKCKHINLTPTPAVASASVNTGILLCILTLTPVGRLLPNSADTV